jgi:hypothetical protein
MENDLKSFNLRKRKYIKIKPKKHHPFFKSNQKINKVIRSHTNSSLNMYFNNNTIDDFILPSYNQKISYDSPWVYDYNILKIKIFH